MKFNSFIEKIPVIIRLNQSEFSEENLKRYREVIRQPYGMILHCGPTGSGKSMTLYSALNEINAPDIVIRTAEDPIEYTLPGINQMQMHRQIGLTFATALRAFLRQDPDIILVGEIRDKETAEIAVEAALTGHLLISTLHTNDAPSTVARLTDMGIEPFMISSSMLAVCAQRLMRRVCKTCRVVYEPSGREKEVLEKGLGWSGQIYKHNPKRCPKCGTAIDSYLVDAGRKLHVCGNNPDCSGFLLEEGQFRRDVQGMSEAVAVTGPPASARPPCATATR